MVKKDKWLNDRLSEYRVVIEYYKKCKILSTTKEGCANRIAFFKYLIKNYKFR